MSTRVFQAVTRHQLTDLEIPKLLPSLMTSVHRAATVRLLQPGFFVWALERRFATATSLISSSLSLKER
jgi:hypothetical protein